MASVAHHGNNHLLVFLVLREQPLEARGEVEKLALLGDLAFNNLGLDVHRRLGSRVHAVAKTRAVILAKCAAGTGGKNIKRLKAASCPLFA